MKVQSLDLRFVIRAVLFNVSISVMRGYFKMFDPLNVGGMGAGA